MSIPQEVQKEVEGWKARVDNPGRSLLKHDFDIMVRFPSGRMISPESYIEWYDFVKFKGFLARDGKRYRLQMPDLEVTHDHYGSEIIDIRISGEFKVLSVITDDEYYNYYASDDDERFQDHYADYDHDEHDNEHDDEPTTADVDEYHRPRATTTLWDYVQVKLA